MPAREKVSVQKITNALLKWRGNVKAAASDLGLTNNGLWWRIQSLGLDLAAIRKLGTSKTTVTSITSKPRIDGEGDPGKCEPPFSRGALGASIQRVSSAVTELSAVRRRQPVRIPPDYLDMLTQAKYDMQALLRRDVTEQEILEMYLEGLAEFLAQRIASLHQGAGEQPAERPGPARRGKDKR